MEEGARPELFCNYADNPDNASMVRCEYMHVIGERLNKFPAFFLRLRQRLSYRSA